MNNDMEMLLLRVSRLERQNKLIKLAGLALVLIVALILFCGAETSNKVIEAREFKVVDGNGKMRASLGMDSDPGLYLYDENGRSLVELSIINEETKLWFTDENGHLRIALTSITDRNPELGLWGKNGKSLSVQ